MNGALLVLVVSRTQDARICRMGSPQLAGRITPQAGA